MITLDLSKAKLNEKAYTDYYGCYKSKMFDFEAKQTQNKDFMMNLIKSQIICLYNLAFFF